MGPLTALLLATPLFGLSLSPPSFEALALSATPIAQLDVYEDSDGMLLAQKRPSKRERGERRHRRSRRSRRERAQQQQQAPQATEMPDPESGETFTPTETAEERAEKFHMIDAETAARRAAEPPAEEAEAAAASGPVLDKNTYRLQLRKRAKLAKIHRTLGITTWALTGLAVVAGVIQFRNLYGGKTAASTPCVQGNAWPNQEQCWGTPWFHAITGFAAGGAYFSTLGLAMAMPDPDNASVGDSKYAKTLRTHKILRWVHLGGMVAQIVLGVVIANPKLSGDLDRASDYGAMRKLSMVHLTTGFITLGALSWAGTIMLL